MLTTSATELGFVIATSAATIGLPEPLLKAAHVRSYQTNLVIPAQRTRFLEQLVGAVASRREQLRHHQVRSVTELLTRDARFAQDPELSDLIIIDGLFEIPNPSELIVRIMHLLTLENALGIYLWLTDPAPLIPDVMNLFSDYVALQTISAAHSREVIGIADAARISEAGVGFVKTGLSSPRLFRVLPPTGSDLDGIDTDSGRTNALRWSQALPESISLTETNGTRVGRVCAVNRWWLDRNLCVHPSLRPFSETYLPPHEVARAHLSVALDVLLVQRPTQGRKVIESYIDFTCSSVFVPSIAHIQTTYLDRVRPATRRNLAAVAAKHALLEIDPDGRMDAKNYADRSATVLKAFALRERGLVRDEVGILRDRFRQSDPEVQWRALGRLGDQDVFWDMTDSTLVDHFNNLVGQRITAPKSEPLPSRIAATISLVAIESVRARLPALEPQFNCLSPQQKASVIEARPAPYFVTAIIQLVQQAPSYRFGDLVGELLVEHASFLTTEHLNSALVAWSNNDQCWCASPMPETGVNLVAATKHLVNCSATDRSRR